MNKTLLIIGGVIFLLALLGGGYYLYSRGQSKVSTPPSSFQNPFIGKPTGSFGAGRPTPTPTLVNPFATPTPTPYQNPFGSSSSTSQPYQNPFEKLR